MLLSCQRSGGYETDKEDNLASCIIEGDRRHVLKHLHGMFPIINTRKMDKIYEYLEENVDLGRFGTKHYPFESDLIKNIKTFRDLR